jgi:hypothetical protein
VKASLVVRGPLWVMQELNNPRTFKKFIHICQTCNSLLLKNKYKSYIFVLLSLSLSLDLSLLFLNALAVGLYFKFTCRQRERVRERGRERERERERDYYVKWKQKCSFLIDKDDDYLVSEEKCIERDQNRVKDKKTKHPSLCFVFLSRRSTSNPFSTPPINQQT